MKIIGAIQADVGADFFKSLGDHEEEQHHAPEDFDYDEAINRIQTAEAGLQQVPLNTAQIATNVTNIASNDTDITTLESIVDANADNIEALDKFFETTNNSYSGTIRHVDKHQITIENLRCVESSSNVTPVDGLQRGLFVTTGYCSEKFQMLNDGRVVMITQSDDPDESDASKLQWSYEFGSASGQVGPNRAQFDGLTFQHVRLDASGQERSNVQQTEKQLVMLRASTDEPNLYIEARSKESEQPIVEIVKDDVNYFVVDDEGQTVASNLAVANTLRLWNSSANPRVTLDGTALKFYSSTPNNAGDNWEVLITAAGYQSKTEQPVPGNPSRTHAVQVGSAVHDPRSVYIGNSRYSYDMTNRTLQMHKLKANHIPVYLQASTSASDLPSGHNASHMTVNKWIDFARSHLNDDSLDVHDVFPYTNADWDAADAPTPTLTAAYNAMSADVDTLETEMDDVEADIVTINGALATKQDTLSAARLAVCDGDVFTAANYSTTTAMNSALANKQDTLSAARLAVCDGDVFTAANYSTTATVNSALANKQDTLSAARLAVCDGDVFTSANYSTAATVNSALALKAPLDNPAFTGSTEFDGDVTLLAGRTFHIGSKMDLLESGSNINWHLNSGDLNIAYAMPSGSKCVLGTASRTLELHGDIEINGTALTSTTAELNYCDGVTSAIQAQLDAKEDTINLTAERAVVSGPTGALRAMSVTSTQVGYLLNVTSDIQTQLDGKQEALTRTNIGTITWSSGPQTATIANVTAKRGYFVVLPTLNQPSITAANRTLEVTIEIASLAETDMVIVPDSQMSNHSGGAINISHARPNSDLGTIRIKLRSAANVDYTGNTTDKFYVSYLVL